MTSYINHGNCLCPRCFPTKRRIKLNQEHKAEVKRFDVALSEFSKAMRKKFIRKLREGYSGWDDDELLASLELYLQEQLSAHIGRRGQEVDIANLAFFLWKCKLTMRRQARKVRERKQ